MKAVIKLVVFIGLVAASSCNAQQTESVTPKSEQEYRSIQFGFNTTYLNSTFKFKPALKKLIEDGHMHIRIYEPFTKALAKNPQKGMQMLKWLDNKGFKVLLSLSNFPYVADQRPNQLSKLPYKNQKFPAKAISYSNRYPPVNTEVYKQFLRSYLTEMETAGIMDSFEFEVGNEPNAPRYFWGDVNDWNTVRDAAIEVLSEFGKRPLCCGYTSSMFLQTPTKEHHLPFIESLQTDTTAASTFDLSFHVYLKMGGGKADLENPVLPVKNAVITEYGMFSHYKEEAAAKKNTSLYVARFAELLEFTYNNEINMVYLFPLMDDGNKKATMGYFDSDGISKNCYSYFNSIWDVVKDGYFVERSADRITITGKEALLIVALAPLTFATEKEVIRSSIRDKSEYKKGDWSILVR